jgi:DNA/RNA-binding domain of Phe-tRNA-synthetase-like protein
VPLADRIASVRYLLIDTTTIPTELHADMIPDVLHRLTADGTFEQLWDDHGVQVWRRAGGPGP